MDTLHFRLFHKGEVVKLCLRCYGFADVTVNFHSHLDPTCSHLGDTPLEMSAKVCPERSSKKGRAILNVGGIISWAAALD